MSIDFLKRLLLFFGLLLAQVLVLNHVHLFGVAIPLLYVYFVLSFPRDYSRNGALVWSFLLGLFIDIFSNTPGVAAFSMTWSLSYSPMSSDCLSSATTTTTYSQASLHSESTNTHCMH